MISYAEALDVVMQTITPLETETKALEQALGSVTATAVTAAWDLPAHNISAMDGYAFLFQRQQPGDTLPVARAIMAGGDRGPAVAAGYAVRIMTGAALPDGCDTVVPLEDLAVSGASICLQQPVNPCQHVRPRGEEMVCGESLLAAGTVLGAAETGLLAAAGVAQITVTRRPTVAILATGDELVELGDLPDMTHGQRVNSSACYLAARLRETGCNVIRLGVAADREELLARLARRGIDAADMLITTGGVSVGDRDLVQEVLQGIGLHVGFWKVAIKPGKAILFGTIDGKPVFGLPGNPAATAATFELFVVPALQQLAGHTEPRPQRIKARLTAPVKGGGRRQNFIWGRVELRFAEVIFTPSERQSSGQNRSLVRCNALLPVATTIPAYIAGDMVEVILLPGTACAFHR